jgi:hypothetical protein
MLLIGVDLRPVGRHGAVMVMRMPYWCWASSTRRIMLFLSIPGIIGGIAILQHARIPHLHDRLSALKLIDIPFGTALGIYTIYALLCPM